jgi:hypothetical protein
MYVTLEEAKRTVWERWHDPAIRQKVKDYVGEIPEFLLHEPRAALIRHLPTPNFEQPYFVEGAKKLGLKPYCSAFTGDKICTMNPDKVALGKMSFFYGKGRKGGDRVISHRVIDFNKYDGKSFAEAKTLWKTDFVDFHRQLLAETMPDVELTDITEWLIKMGGKPKLFWHRLLSLFICHGILFENFHSQGPEENFTNEIILPALEKVKTYFGLKPLIVPIVPIEKEREPYWSWYPGHLEQRVKHCLARTG